MQLYNYTYTINKVCSTFYLKKYNTIYLVKSLIKQRFNWYTYYILYNIGFSYYLFYSLGETFELYMARKISGIRIYLRRFVESFIKIKSDLFLDLFYFDRVEWIIFKWLCNVDMLNNLPSPSGVLWIFIGKGSHIKK